MASTATSLLVSVEDYLRHGVDGVVRHEYIGGRIHAMAGTSEAHNLISVNLASAFHAHLRGGPSKAYMADFKVRLDQDTPEITIHRRFEDWRPHVLTALDAAAEFRSIKLSLPVGRIYEGAL